MRVDGKAIANTILEDLKAKNIAATLAVILVGDNPASFSYIKQKQKAAEAIGSTLIFEHLKESTTPDGLSSLITKYNNDLSIHGLIIQRPVPIPNINEVLKDVAPSKDIDGFIPNSAFQPPVARAIITILQTIHEQLFHASLTQNEFISWLQKQSIAVIGRGETAGRPIAALLKNYDCATSIIHSHTQNPEEITKSADIIVSCVGKKATITKRRIKPGVILISVGLWRDSEEKLHGDYEEDAIGDIASFYTPTPGGVGPVNVASLMQNLLDACILQTGGTQ